ncbi:MAG: hypothetical protein ACXVQU_12905, partial [Actinomycetota bacterium]
MLLLPFARHGYRFGLGPDVPVYLWWARVGASQGVSVVGARPGSPALIAVLAWALHLPVAAVTAGLEAALGTAVATATAMLVRAAGAMRGERRGARAAWILGGLLTGLFTVHLAAGYLANLAFAAPFVAAGVTIAAGTRRGALVAAVLLGGGGLAHPQFFLLGVLILALVGGWSLLAGERGWTSDAGRIALAVGGGGALVGGGVASMAIGSARLVVDTSKDGFLRRAGLAGAVRHAYLERFLHRWTRYVQWLALPLAALALTRTGGFARRLLIAWTAIVVIGSPIGMVTGWYPADRLITFGFSVPALAGVAVVAVWLWLERRAWLAWCVAAFLAGLMAAGALIAWSRQTPFISPLEVERATVAAADIQDLPRGTTLVFLVDDADATASFLATRAANVIRASMPPDRAADVFVYVGTQANFLAGRPTVRGSAEYDTLSRLYLHDIPTSPAHPAIGIVLAPFDRTASPTAPGFQRWARGVYATAPSAGVPTVPARDPLTPSSPGQIAFAAIAIVALTTLAGWGWARWCGLDLLASLAVAPAAGIATIVLAGIALDRVGISLTGRAGP